MQLVKPERTGWRDLALSERHRAWGWDCPAVDLDFLFLEYDRGIPTAIVEYKNEHSRPVSLGNTNMHAISVLATRAGLPFFVTRYSSAFTWWEATPVNDVAREKLGGRDKFIFSERQWVQFLYRLRGYEAPATLLDNLNRLV